ncbi:hypothetical protein BD309DRAFT_970827 [Dichomitus squalens]|nr:hypothetical protein BD309DRAFT_970827 [Dichomitus squalens]
MKTTIFMLCSSGTTSVNPLRRGRVVEASSPAGNRLFRIPAFMMFHAMPTLSAISVRLYPSFAHSLDVIPGRCFACSEGFPIAHI